MKAIFIFCIVLSAILSTPVFAHESDIEHTHATFTVKEVKASLAVQGTIVVDQKQTTVKKVVDKTGKIGHKFIVGKKLRNSAIVNQTAVWAGETYTYNPETGKISVRAVEDAKYGLPAIKIAKVGNGKVIIEYTDGVQRTPAVIEKKTKKRK